MPDTAEYLLVAKRLGFAAADLDEMTIGLFLDVCADASGETVKDATQADIDKFFM